jgi:hypothetical protein
MNASLRALLTGAIDYAGLFPPAQLPLEQALRNDTSYRGGPDAWMLARFVCPAARLNGLTTCPPLSVVGRGGATAADFLAGQQQDRLDITAFCRRQPGAAIECYEVRIPRELLQPERSRDLRAALTRLEEPTAAFFEVEYGGRWTVSVGMLVTALGEMPGRQKGLKIRCGGATAASVPTADDIGFALAACRSAGVPAKFTAGLHHPLRRHDQALGTKTHGFLNVFVAGVLGHARGLDAAALRPVLEEEDATSFRFDDAGLGWRDLRATTDEVVAARKRALISFGSCSFDEPREDLRTLGLME